MHTGIRATAPGPRGPPSASWTHAVSSGGRWAILRVGQCAESPGGAAASLGGDSGEGIPVGTWSQLLEDEQVRGWRRGGVGAWQAEGRPPGMGVGSGQLRVFGEVRSWPMQ